MKFVWITFACFSLILAEIPKASQYKIELETYLKAMYEHNFSMLEVYTTDEEKVEKGGDPQGFQTYLAQQAEALRASQSHITDLTIQEAHSYVETEKYAFFLVEVDYVKTVYGRDFELKHLFMGVRDLVSPSWRFINTSKYGRKKMQQFYEELPTSLAQQIRELPPQKIFNHRGEELRPQL